MTKRSRWTMAITVVLATLAGMLPTTALADGEWYAEYFANTSLAGGPVLTRFEADINHNWGDGSPDGVADDGFSARYTRDVWFAAGTYRFSYASDDGLRVWVDDVLVVDGWWDQGATWHFVDHFVAGGVHRVRVEYYENWGFANLQVGWDRLRGGDGWQATYWPNTDLAGSSALHRTDAAIDFDWGSGSPDPAVPVDNFSARWARTLGFTAGTYRFYAAADDGVRIYVDEVLIVDAWTKQKLPNTHYADIVLDGGNHVVLIDYFEEGGEAAIHVWWDRLEASRGWEGRYYDNRDLRGGPALVRDDAAIDFDWGEAGPADWMPADNFSVRWVKTLALQPGMYRFNSISDDGLRLWIDDVDLRLNNWVEQEATWHYQDWHWLEGPHTLRVEYFDGAGGAQAKFWWDYAATVAAAQAMPPSPVPKSISTATAPAAPAARPPSTPAVAYPGPWTGEYFGGRDLAKSPVLTRTDPTINFDWGWNAPVEGVSANQFAVRWTGDFTFEEGRYRFTTTTDDGVRVFLDDETILSSWRPMRGTRYATVRVPAGTHTVRVEYFEAMQAAKAQLTWERVGD